MKRMFILLGVLAILQGLSFWSAYHWNDIITSTLFLTDLLALIALVIQLIRIKGHIAIRSSLGIVVISWVAFMVYVAWSFFTQVD